MHQDPERRHESTGSAQLPERERILSPFVAPGVKLIDTELDTSSSPSQMLTLHSADEAALVFHSLIGGSDREKFAALYLNARHVVTHAHIVSIGTSQSSLVHPREVFKGAILANAAAILVGHNHPSGDMTRSPEDAAVNQRLRDAGELLGIPVLDSLIVGPSRTFFSEAEGRILTLPQWKR